MKHTWKRLAAVLLAAVMTLGLLPAAALAAGETERAATLPAGNMWAYVNFTAKWGMGTEPYNVKLYKMDGSTGTAASSMSDGTYLICAPAPTSGDPRWMHVDNDSNKNATNQCSAGTTVPGDTVTTTDTAHQFLFTADADGWYTIKSVANTGENRYLNTCGVGTNDQIPLSATPTKFAVVKSGSDAGMFTIAAAVVNPDAPPDLSELTEPLYGAIVDDDLQYVRANFNAALAADAKTAALNAWRNDTAVSQILLATGKNAQTRVTAAAGDFSDGEGHTIAAGNVDLSFIKVVQAYTGMPGWGDSHGVAVPTGSRKDAAEVLMGSDPVNMDAGTVQGLWVSVNVPEDAEPGSYSGQITVTADGLAEAKKLTFTYTLNVASSVLPNATEFKDGFDIELWQNPYASAEYYDVEPFSAKHFAILRPIMEKYKSIGGHAITTTIAEDAWARQTYSQNEVHIPSMVAWSKDAAGEWVFDYTDFDKWIEFNINEIGIGDKIVCYSTAPWTNEIRYLDAAGTKQVIRKPDADSSDEAAWAAWNEGWTAFLTDLMAHMEEKGWKDQTYIGIDERGIDDAALTLIESVTGTDGKPFKKAGAMDQFTAHHDLAMRIDDLNVGSIAVKGSPAAFASLLAEREAAGLRTTVYSCTGHVPGNFSLSAPGESYWTMLYSYAAGGTGFLRWAYDSWVANPLQDTSHAKFEAGDCFLIFPDEKDAENPVAHSSLRLEKMAQGVRDVNKLMTIQKNCPAMDTAVNALLVTVKANYDNTKGSGSWGYLTDAGKTALAADMKTLRQGIVSLTAEYEERLALGATKKVNLQPKDVPIVMLPEQYQGDVYGPILDRSKQYYGQPDMITLPDGTLVTVFPQGHGHGPLIMMKSDNRGENWEEIETPPSWADSLETPTMYRLSFTDGSVRYIMITARPSWSGSNSIYGWDASISDDGIHWSESQRFHSENYETIVAMASLVQLKDKSGNFIDKWMGVFHDGSFRNLKTYLTFDAQGNMQWSRPEPYLAEYRSIESAKQICEVGMFRSPDGNRIVAMGRTQSHNCLSVIFWSDDEGETWTKPMDMQGALYGERHKALYDPISGRLVITFREMICTGENSNGGFGGWTCGEWMAWVGTYEDLMEFNEGQYRIRLDEDWAPSGASGDTGYTGMAVYPDGTFVLDTYGHWDEEFSTTQGYGSKADRCWIRRAKFKLSDIDALYKTRLETEVPTEELSSAVLAKNAKANSEQSPAANSDGPAAWAFDDSNHWWHSRHQGTAGEGEVSNGRPSASNHIWIQTGFDEAREITAISYQPRGNGACRIKDYELQYANLEDPTAVPTDSDFRNIKTGTLAATDNQQTITLEEPVTATHIRLVATSEIDGANKYITAKRIRVYAVGEAAYRSDAAQLTSLTVGGQSVAVRGADLGAVTVDAGTDSVVLTAAYSAKAKLNILVNGRPIAKDAPVSLAGDVTQVKLRVVAEDGVTTSVYDLAIVKEKEDNAQLRQLSLGTLKLYPAFDPAVTEYYAVAYGNRTAGLTAVAAQPGATLTYEAVADAGTGTGTVSGATCRFFKSELESAAGGKLYYTEDGRLYNTVTVTVTAPDGSGSTPYTIHVEVRESAYLSDLGWSSIVGNVPIRDRAWSYNDLSLIGENGSEITFDTPKGLGVRANTVVEYNLSDWGFDTLSGRVGVSYAQRASTNVPELQFRVILDGQEAMMQSSTKDAAAPDAFTVDLGAANKLALRTTAVGGSVTDADGNWTDLRLSTIIPLLENLDSKPITALEFAEHETHTIYANEGDVDNTVTLRPTVTPVDSPELLLWESDDTAVATVNDGVVTAVAPGTATITVRASGSPETIFATCTVTVKQKLMGSVTVSGANEGVAKYGATLTADLNTFAQEAKDHLDIQWYRGETAIPGAKEQNYVVQAEDIEETLKVVITGKDPYEGTSASRVLSVTKADGLRMQATPTHRNVSGEGAEDGAITGLFKGRAYEYQTWTLDGTMPALTDPWTPVEWPDGTVEEVPGEGDTYGTGEISGLGVGNYRVRRAETDTHFAGEPSATVSIVVPGGAEVELVVPQNVEGGTVRANRDQIPVGDTVTLWVTVDEGYQFKSLTVTDASSNDIPVSSGTEDGVYTFLMPATRATVAVEFERKTYTITHALEHIDCDMAEHEHQASHGQELTILLTPHAGYEMPRSLTVTNTNTGAAFTDYTYLPDSPNSPNRELHFAHGVTGNLTVKGEGVLKRYTVVYHLTDGLRASNAPQTATHATGLAVTLSAAPGYALPEEIDVTVDNVTLDADAYTYNAETGAVAIPGASVTGNIVITAAGEARALTLQTISLIGPAREGRTLTVKTVPVNATVEYQWIMVDENGDETEIEGATQQEYFIPADAVGQKIKVRVNGTGSYAGVLTSEPTATILREAEPFVFVDSVRVQADAEVNVGRTVKLSAEAEPSNATSPILFWSSSNEAIATVDQNGVVKGVAEGTVTITVASTDRLANRTATCRVTVTKPASPSRPSGTTTPSETTTTETRDDGTKVTTVTKPDGSKTQTVEQPDGTKSELAVTKDGDVTITVTDKDGEELVKAEIPAEIPETETRFDDVPEGHWADKAIHNAAALDLVNGTGDNKYSPVASMTRGSLATVLHRLSQGKTDYEVTFRDVAETKFYAPGVAWAAKAGVVTGYTADTFAPEDIITREQLAVMLARYAKLIGMNTKADAKALDKFNDGQNTGAWAVDGMAWCVENGIIQGKDGNRLDPTTDVSRAEVAMMLDRFIALLK